MLCSTSTIANAAIDPHGAARRGMTPTTIPPSSGYYITLTMHDIRLATTRNQAFE